MATKATRITSTKEVIITKMIPTQVTEVQTTTADVALMELNFRSNKERQFDASSFGDLIRTMQSNGVDFTIRVKASKSVTPASKKALVSLNNLLVRLGKEAGVSARKDKPDTPTEACNNCSKCVGE